MTDDLLPASQGTRWEALIGFNEATVVVGPFPPVSKPFFFFFSCTRAKHLHFRVVYTLVGLRIPETYIYITHLYSYLKRGNTTCETRAEKGKFIFSLETSTRHFEITPL